MLLQYPVHREREQHHLQSIMIKCIIKTESGLKKNRHVMNKITCVEEKPP